MKRGAAIGGLFVCAGILTWSATNRPVVIWAVLAVLGVAGAVWGRPWGAALRVLVRLGTGWLGLAYWVLGIAGAVLVGHATVALQRLAYAGVFTLAALAVVAAVRRGGDASVGVTVAILAGIGALLLAGAPHLFDTVHPVPNDSPPTLLMRDRFWGGPPLYYHPNSLAGLAVLAAARIGPDRRFAAWQRLAAAGLAGFVLYLTGSRTAFVVALCAAVVHGYLVWRGNVSGYRRRWLAVLAPFLILAAVLAPTGGGGFLFPDRFGNHDVTSGRVDTWRQVITDWRHAGWAEKTFGDARTSRAVVVRDNDGAPPQGPRLKLNTDSAAVGALRHGGVLGVLAFALGLVLLLRHTLRRGPPPWFAVAVLAMLPTLATEDWLLGGTNGALWILLLAGEAWSVAGVQRDREAVAQPELGHPVAGP